MNKISGSKGQVNCCCRAQLGGGWHFRPEPWGAPTTFGPFFRQCEWTIQKRCSLSGKKSTLLQPFFRSLLSFLHEQDLSKMRCPQHKRKVNTKEWNKAVANLGMADRIILAWPETTLFLVGMPFVWAAFHEEALARLFSLTDWLTLRDLYPPFQGRLPCLSISRNGGGYMNVSELASRPTSTPGQIIRTWMKTRIGQNLSPPNPSFWFMCLAMTRSLPVRGMHNKFTPVQK